MTWHLIPSEFSYTYMRKFSFLFISVEKGEIGREKQEEKRKAEKIEKRINGIQGEEGRINPIK
jgi:hypothetical protein